MPILNELRDLLLPNIKTILATADDALKKERRGILAVAGLRDALIEAAIISSNETSLAQVDALESETTRVLSGLDRKGLKIMEKNIDMSMRKKHLSASLKRAGNLAITQPA